MNTTDRPHCRKRLWVAVTRSVQGRLSVVYRFSVLARTRSEAIQTATRVLNEMGIPVTSITVSRVT